MSIFRFLDHIGSANGDTLFVVFCFTLRIFLAIGCTASATASFAVTASVFPDHVATVFGLLETATGLGMMVGPALGGVLYQVGRLSLFRIVVLVGQFLFCFLGRIVHTGGLGMSSLLHVQNLQLELVV